MNDVELLKQIIEHELQAKNRDKFMTLSVMKEFNTQCEKEESRKEFAEMKRFDEAISQLLKEGYIRKENFWFFKN